MYTPGIGLIHLLCYLLSVNFNKLIPKASAIKTSAVLRELNVEAVKTDEDKLKEARKWTTFLQKPNRPIPRTKEELARQKLPQYKVNIVKQPKPRGAPGREPTPPAVVEEIEIAEEEPAVEPECEISEEVENETEQIPSEDQENCLSADQIESLAATTTDNEVPDLVAEEETTVAGIPTELEKQLADVQKQLLALSNLPQAIQATLDAVTTELAKIVPVILEVSSKQASVDRDYRSKSPSRDIESQTEMMVIEETVEESIEMEEKCQGQDQRERQEENSLSSSQSECSQDDACSMSSMGTPAGAQQSQTKEQLLEVHQQELKTALQNRRNEVSKR